MAEVAAGLWAAEEAVSTTVQLGIGAYFLSKPTQPLKAVFLQIATSEDDETRNSLCRSDHTLTVIDNRAYIFGGQTATEKLASAEMHAVTLMSKDAPQPDYSVIPAIPAKEGGKLPSPRRKHAACAFNGCVAVFGGLDEDGKVIDEGHGIWLFNGTKSAWETVEPADDPKHGPVPRSSATLLHHQSGMILCGGQDASGAGLKDVWLFDYVVRAWSRLPDAPVVHTNASVSSGVLHVISSVDNMSGDLHILQITPKEGEEHKWHTVTFPTNPLTPGPRPRAGAGLLPVTTGYGRHYLLYILGARQDASSPVEAQTEPPEVHPESAEEPKYWSDVWTYQLPSSQVKPTSITDSFKPAKIKDSIRSALGYDSGQHSWAEVEVLPPTDMQLGAGKVHPGPRGFFGCDVMADGQSVVIWGGVNAKGEKEGDGWIIKIE
ncbi:hypothetical protein K470DRAFT_222279 [Piedraia hortae CBS 480.64]|uniref:Galactose oxidase n=1 Tax=Piedraia hortae CBS 480.64 TaxID=1314780 RepID=A0A6A7BRX0_9PEZI|nr:hypothetical protein K470DRAFT_222279 [Piedraia hortae CBS 480.64]